MNSSKTKKAKADFDLHRKAKYATQNMEGFIKKKGGEILDLTENEINEYKKGGWIVERIN